MTPVSPLIIEKDLVRWSRSRWLGFVLSILLLQITFLVLTRAPEIQPGANNQKEPSLAFVSDSAKRLDVSVFDNPTLFASANAHGFSGSAWIHRQPRAIPTERTLPKISFLSFQDVRFIHESEGDFDLRPVKDRSLIPDPDVPSTSLSSPQDRSNVRIEGLTDADLVTIPPLPDQVATDALGSTEVQVLVDSQGIIFSARVWSSSGSKTADNQAVFLAKKARFHPRKAAELSREQMMSGKLIFDWHSVPPGGTNSAPR